MTRLTLLKASQPLLRSLRSVALPSTGAFAGLPAQPCVGRPLFDGFRRYTNAGEGNKAQQNTADATKPKESQSTQADQKTETSASSQNGQGKGKDTTAKSSEEAQLEMEKKLAQLKNDYLRCLADMENLRQRTKQEVDRASKFAIGKFAKDLLDTVDILTMALKAVPEADRTAETENSLSNFYSGVNLTQAELLKTLKRHGVEAIDPLDKPFDPNLHQAMYEVEIPDKGPGLVISVEKLGYTLHGRVVRPAQVGVTKIEK
ncbi:GrpE, mitochondrial [Dispira simplex]|nr:GrpE, mitochondrial [Dispira simplex]